MSTTFSWVTADDETVSLDGSEGIQLLIPVIGLDVPPVERQVEQRVAFDGGVTFRSRVPPRPFSLPLYIDENVASLRNVARWFANPAGRGTLIATIGGIDRTLENVEYRGGLEGEYAETSGLGWRLVTVDMEAMDPWWQGPVQTTLLNIGAVTTFDNAAVTFDDPLTPFDGGNATILAVSGDTYSFPKFVITGPFTTLVLDGGNQGETVVLAGPLAAGEQIVIDSTPGNRGPMLNGGLVNWNLLTVGSRLWTLVNPSDTVSSSATGTTGASSVEVRWRNRYLAP
jgi:hypothetical protein